MSEQCYLCRGKNLVLLSERGRGNITLINKVCRDCGLAQRSPMPGPEEVMEYYSTGSFIDENQDRNYDRLFKKQYNAFYLRASLLRENIIDNKLYKDRPLRILEIGSHIGTFLAACVNVFPEARVSGIEPDRGAAEFSRTAAKAEIHQMTFDNFCNSYSGEKFDVIVSFAVLEHIHDPLGFMNMVRGIIKPGGAVFFEVPNMHSHSTGWPFWYDWYLKEHLFHFSAPTIRRLFAQSGFIVKKTYEDKTLRAFAVESKDIPQELLSAKDDYNKVLKSHEAFKKEHLFQQLANPVKLLKLILFLLLGHQRAFRAIQFIKENLAGKR